MEGPALLRHDGMFYLLYSAGHCCGPRCNYVTGVARSRSLLGPWEKRPGPFLEDSAAFRCPGHVGVAGAPGGGLLLAYHAYARGDPAIRQFLIAPLHFDAQDWPELGPAANRAAGAAPAHLDFGDEQMARGGSGRSGHGRRRGSSGESCASATAHSAGRPARARSARARL